MKLYSLTVCVSVSLFFSLFIGITCIHKNFSLIITMPKFFLFKDWAFCCRVHLLSSSCLFLSVVLFLSLINGAWTMSEKGEGGININWYFSIYDKVFWEQNCRKWDHFSFIFVAVIKCPMKSNSEDWSFCAQFQPTINYWRKPRGNLKQQVTSCLQSEALRNGCTHSRLLA